MKLWRAVAYGGILFLSACKQKEPAVAAPVSREEKVQADLQRLKTEAATGDLVVRLGDDLLSYQIKFLNEQDQSYSHAGIVVERNGEKFVAHTTPDNPETDGLQFAAIDSFLNPAKNLTCALYRYSLTPAERDSFAAKIEGYKTLHLRFDRLYDLNTDGEMYCSEMIAKTLEKTTGGRLRFRTVSIPEKFLPAMERHFGKLATRESIAQRKIMTIDNLYRLPECRLLMAFPLKTLPGQ